MIDEIPTYQTAPMVNIREGVSIIREDFLRDLIKRIAYRSHDLVMRSIDQDHFVVELVVRGKNSKLYDIATLARCDGDNARSNTGECLAKLKESIKVALKDHFNES